MTSYLHSTLFHSCARSVSNTDSNFLLLSCCCHCCFTVVLLPLFCSAALLYWGSSTEEPAREQLQLGLLSEEAAPELLRVSRVEHILGLVSDRHALSWYYVLGIGSIFFIFLESWMRSPFLLALLYCPLVESDRRSYDSSPSSCATSSSLPSTLQSLRTRPKAGHMRYTRRGGYDTHSCCLLSKASVDDLDRGGVNAVHSDAIHDASLQRYCNSTRVYNLQFFGLVLHAPGHVG